MNLTMNYTDQVNCKFMSVKVTSLVIVAWISVAQKQSTSIYTYSSLQFTNLMIDDRN